MFSIVYRIHTLWLQPQATNVWLRKVLSAILEDLWQHCCCIKFGVSDSSHHQLSSSEWFLVFTGCIHVWHPSQATQLLWTMYQRIYASHFVISKSNSVAEMTKKLRRYAAYTYVYGLNSKHKAVATWVAPFVSWSFKHVCRVQWDMPLSLLLLLRIL